MSWRAAPDSDVTMPTRGRQGRQRALALGREQALRVEPPLELLERELEGAEAERLELLDHELEPTSLRVDGERARGHHGEAVLDLEAQPPGPARPHHAVERRRLVLEREVEVPATGRLTGW